MVQRVIARIFIEELGIQIQTPLSIRQNMGLNSDLNLLVQLGTGGL